MGRDTLAEEFVQYLSPASMTACLPDTRWLPRKVKKAWRKMMDGRFLTTREWRQVEMLTSRRRKRVRYIRVPLHVRLVEEIRGEIL